MSGCARTASTCRCTHIVVCSSSRVTPSPRPYEYPIGGEAAAGSGLSPGSVCGFINEGSIGAALATAVGYSSGLLSGPACDLETPETRRLTRDLGFGGPRRRKSLGGCRRLALLWSWGAHNNGVNIILAKGVYSRKGDEFGNVCFVLFSFFFYFRSVSTFHRDFFTPFQPGHREDSRPRSFVLA